MQDRHRIKSSRSSSSSTKASCAYTEHILELLRDLQTKPNPLPKPVHVKTDAKAEGPSFPPPLQTTVGPHHNPESASHKMSAKAEGAKCTVCKTSGGVGMARYVCLICEKITLCEECYEGKRCSEQVQHRSYHPMQLIEPRMQLRGSGQIVPDLGLFRCALCGDGKFKIDDLVEHCQKYHANSPNLVHCPVCVTFGTSKTDPNLDPNIGGRALLLHHFWTEHKFPEIKMACSMCGQGTNDRNRFACLVCEKYQLCDACHQNKVQSKLHMPFHPMQLVQPVETLRAASTPNTVSGVAGGSKEPDVPREMQIFCCPYCGEADFSIPELAQHCQDLHRGREGVLKVRCPVCAVLRVPIKESCHLEGSLLEHLGEYHCSLEVVGAAEC